MNRNQPTTRQENTMPIDMTKEQIISALQQILCDATRTCAEAGQELNILNTHGHVDAHDRSKLNLDTRGDVHINDPESRLGKITRLQSTQWACEAVGDVVVELLDRALRSEVDSPSDGLQPVAPFLARMLKEQEDLDARPECSACDGAGYTYPCPNGCTCDDLPTHDMDGSRFAGVCNVCADLDPTTSTRMIKCPACDGEGHE